MLMATNVKTATATSFGTRVEESFGFEKLGLKIELLSMIICKIFSCGENAQGFLVLSTSAK